MIDSKTIQLTTLWFVVMIFIQTMSADNPPINAIGFLALLLVLVLPVVILGRLAATVFADGGWSLRAR
ncbi:hypothetical protein PNQ29_10675 [Halobacterium salinarum]|uniref:hypothetical protein n=1 Tax=Halobacterium salinarum TaxID=2242 RepID=UPI0025570107|nr:hypothetical protein [Halobacterium salinarum]MDL0120188.1 hypothetical protein [Halobacterium salinarum]